MLLVLKPLGELDKTFLAIQRKPSHACAEALEGEARCS